jgi:transketolase
LKYPYEGFEVPAEVYGWAEEFNKQAQAKQDAWNALTERYKNEYPSDWKEWESWHSKELPVDLDNLPDFWQWEGSIASRQSSQKVLNKLCKLVPNLFGGSADLAPSTLTIMEGRGDYSAGNRTGANLHFGIREHAMTAIANAIAAHGGLRPYVAGFFVFADYMKPAMRLSALMKLPVVYVLTHDSIGVGEDGPTHQPVEQLAMLRSIPGFTVIRPCDTHETAAAWALAMKRTNSPTALVLSRQNLPLLAETAKENCPDIYKGAYVIKDNVNPATGKPDVILIGTGSEVSLCYSAADTLLGDGIHARVVSMPSMEIFEEQSEAYKETILPSEIRARVAVEAASPFGWHKYIGLDGVFIGVDGFGASGPAGTVFKEYGITAEAVVEAVKSIVSLCE